MYGFEYLSAKTERQIKDRLKAFYSVSESPRLLEIFTPRTVNDDILLQYFEFLK